MGKTRLPSFLTVACCAAVLVATQVASRGQGRGGGEEGLELVDQNVLRVCSDPNNLPFSNDKGEGFENKLAELLAEKLNRKLAYNYYQQATGFVRMMLGSHRCDVIMGYPQGDDMVQSTNPYYQTAYALVTKRGSPLNDVTTLADPRLQGKHIGVVAGTPPATYLVADGLMANAKPYPLVVDTRFNSSGDAMMKDLASGEIDAGVLWGPIAGYRASRANVPMHVQLLLKDTGGPRMVYRITMGVRPSDQNWKRQLNTLIAQNHEAMDKVLLDFGVPLLDANDQPIAGDAATPKQ